MSRTASPRVSVSLGTREHDALAGEAKRQGRSESNLARRYVIDGLKRDKAIPDSDGGRS